MINWLSYPENIPEVKEDYGTWTESEPVLATDGKHICFAVLRIWDKEYDRTPQWQKSNRDSWNMNEPIRYWMPLPTLPKRKENL